MEWRLMASWNFGDESEHNGQNSSKSIWSDHSWGVPGVIKSIWTRFCHFLIYGVPTIKNLYGSPLGPLCHHGGRGLGERSYLGPNGHYSGQSWMFDTTRNNILGPQVPPRSPGFPLWVPSWSPWSPPNQFLLTILFYKCKMILDGNIQNRAL